MKTISLASGSKGNCIYIESKNAKILIDLGLTVTAVCEKLQQISVDPKDITAIFITHEHIDHCLGVGAFARKYKTKIYVHTSGYPYIIKKIGKIAPEQVVTFVNSEFFVEDLTITPFVLPHDSNFCVGYSFVCGSNKISVATDLGFMSEKTLNYLKKSDVLFIESNHDEKMLLNNPKYSASLKTRILSNRGHLSNVACGKALVELVKSGVKQVVLSHLSEENNTPSLAYNTVKKVLANSGIIEGENVFVDVATQGKIGTLFEIKD